MLIGTAGILMLILSVVAVRFLKRSKNEDEDWFEEEEELYEELTDLRRKSDSVLLSHALKLK